MGVLLLGKVPGLLNLEDAAALLAKVTREPLKYMRSHVFNAWANEQIRLYDRFGKARTDRRHVYQPSSGEDGDDIKANPYLFVDIDDLMGALTLSPHIQSLVKSELAQASIATAPATVAGRSPLKKNKEESNPATAAPVFSMRRDAMVTKYQDRWPTIARDMKDASTNGLSRAKAGHRDWNEQTAIEWAKAKGKLIEVEGVNTSLGDAMRNLAKLPVTKHTLKG